MKTKNVKILASALFVFSAVIALAEINHLTPSGLHISTHTVPTTWGEPLIWWLSVSNGSVSVKQFGASIVGQATSFDSGQVITNLLGVGGEGLSLAPQKETNLVLQVPSHAYTNFPMAIFRATVAVDELAFDDSIWIEMIESGVTNAPAW